MTSTNNSIIIRVGNGTLAFMTPTANGTMTFHPYPVKSGMSMAANLRTAFQVIPELSRTGLNAKLLVASPPLLIPMQEYDRYTDNDTNPEGGFEVDAIYGETITGHKGEMKVISEIHDLDVVSIFPVNSDLKMVVSDHCRNVKIENVMTAMWQYLYRKYYKSNGKRRLFIYFHDKLMDVCSFDQHRFRFANNFCVTHAHDALYFVLYVWKQLGMSQQDDELFVLGDMPHEAWFMERLKTYVSKVNVIENTATDNRMPFDLTLCE